MLSIQLDDVGRRPSRRLAMVVAGGLMLVVCVVALLMNAGDGQTVGDEETKWDQVVGKTTGVPCDTTSNPVVAAMHAAFVEESKKLLDLKGRMEEALKEDDCASVVKLAATLQQSSSEFSSLKEEYKNLAPTDQQAVGMCFDATLFPQSNGIQEYAVKSLSQCGNSNPLVAQANALIDAATSQVASQTDDVGSRADCQGMAELMDVFTKNAQQFEDKLSSILSKLTQSAMQLEVKLITITADHKMLSATDKFFDAWVDRWGSMCPNDNLEATPPPPSDDDDSNNNNASSSSASSSDEQGSSSKGAAVVASSATTGGAAASSDAASDDAVDHAAGGDLIITSTSAAPTSATTAAAAAHPAGVVEAAGTTAASSGVVVVAAGASTGASSSATTGAAASH